MGAIQRAVQILAGTYDKDLLSFEVAKVQTVDTQNWLCSAQLVSSTVQTIYNNIQLTSEKTSNGFIQVPKINSNVILAITWRNEIYVFMCSEVDALVFHQQNCDGSYEEFIISTTTGTANTPLPLGIQLVDGGGNGIVISSTGTIQLNDGSYGGLVIANGTSGLQNQLNNMNAQLQAVISSLTNWAPTPNDGGAALKTYFSTQIAGKQQADFSSIINADITHGPKTN